jgi:RimJ/RimL family protein N-acetyltransferase
MNPVNSSTPSSQLFEQLSPPQLSPPMFTTDRLFFRAYRAADIDNLLLLYNDPLVATYITEDFVVPRHVDNFDKIMQMVKNSVMFCIVEEKDGGAFVGWSAILPMSDAKNRNATFGIAFLPTFWSKGYGMETGNFFVDYAFRCLAMHRVSLTVFEGNDRAVELYKRMCAFSDLDNERIYLIPMLYYPQWLHRRGETS